MLSLLIIGPLLLLGLLAWEWKGAKSPLIPFRIFKGQRLVGLTFGIAFLNGMYSHTADNLGPSIIKQVFAPTPTQIGLYALCPSLSLLIGAIGFNFFLSYLRGAARELVTIAAVLMSSSCRCRFVSADTDLAAFGGALAASSPTTIAMFLVFSSIASIGASGLDATASTIVTIAWYGLSASDRLH